MILSTFPSLSGRSVSSEAALKFFLILVKCNKSLPLYFITVLLSYISQHESFLVDVFKDWQSHKGRFVSNWTIGSGAIASYCLQVECLHTVSLGELTENKPRCLTFQETLVPTGSSYVSYQLPLKSKQRLSNSNQRRWTSPEQEPTKRSMALGYTAIQHYTCFKSSVLTGPMGYLQ